MSASRPLKIGVFLPILRDLRMALTPRWADVQTMARTAKGSASVRCGFPITSSSAFQN